MIYLIGPSSDSTTRYFAREAATLHAAVQWIDLSTLADGRWHIDVDRTAELWMGGHRVRLRPGAAVYARLIEEGDLGPGEATRSHALLVALASWLELSAGRVINRPGHALDNGSKPFHEACLRRTGFRVPASLTSSDPERLRVFAETHPAVVKTISGIRADCRRVDPVEFLDFHPDQGPVHLQAAVDGLDVRAHVIDASVIAVGVRSRAVDYRAADDAEYFPCELPLALTVQLVEATREMGLTFAGWDFKVSGEGVFYTLEANPMPGYHLYDRAAQGAITRALLDYLGQAP